MSSENFILLHIRWLGTFHLPYSVIWCFSLWDSTMCLPYCYNILSCFCFFLRILTQTFILKQCLVTYNHLSTVQIIYLYHRCEKISDKLTMKSSWFFRDLLLQSHLHICCEYLHIITTFYCLLSKAKYSGLPQKPTLLINFFAHKNILQLL